MKIPSIASFPITQAMPCLRAHVPEPPAHDPSTPPDIPPPGEPDKEVDLPPREEPDEIRDPGKSPREDPPMRACGGPRPH
ncbi:MAG: hypothetical protein WBA83_15085 [Burkholderiaceae bacterium]